MNAVFALLLAALAIPPLVGRVLGGAPPNPVPKLAALAPAATVPAAAAVALAATYAWWLAILLAVPATVLAIWQLPPRRPRPSRASPPRQSPGNGPPGNEPAATRIVMLTVNTLGGNARAENIVRSVREQHVDVLAVQELTPGLACRLAEAGLTDLLPCNELQALPGHGGTGIWSRWPVQPLPPVGGLACAAPRAVLSIAGQPVTVTAIHLLTPLRRERQWQRELGLLQSVLTSTAGPQLVAGDFNATRDHGPFRRLLDAGFYDCADAASKRRWPAFTWPSGRHGIPVMRLDHVLATRAHFAVQGSRTVWFPGTDHRGVLAVVQLQNP
jgi:endonuclease/exonuclease/phosphatase (EEP) superfamily protein YafD